MDQAAGLRRLLARPAVRVLALASVLAPHDQALLAVQLGAALARRGTRPVLLDASAGEVAAVLGTAPRHDLLELLEGRRQFPEVALAGPEELRVVCGERGIAALEHADAGGWQELFAAFGALREPAGLVLLNLAPGGLRIASRATGGASEVALALGAGTGDVTGAYALVKAAQQLHGQRRYRLLFVDAAPAEAIALATRMRDTAHRFLGAELAYGATLPPAREPADLISLADSCLEWSLPEFAQAP
jgi:flagellar biosynthesis protein FlhG